MAAKSPGSRYDFQEDDSRQLPNRARVADQRQASPRLTAASPDRLNAYDLTGCAAPVTVVPLYG